MKRDACWTGVNQLGNLDRFVVSRDRHDDARLLSASVSGVWVRMGRGWLQKQRDLDVFFIVNRPGSSAITGTLRRTPG